MYIKAIKNYERKYIPSDKGIDPLNWTSSKSLKENGIELEKRNKISK